MTPANRKLLARLAYGRHDKQFVVLFAKRREYAGEWPARCGAVKRKLRIQTRAAPMMKMQKRILPKGSPGRSRLAAHGQAEPYGRSCITAGPRVRSYLIHDFSRLGAIRNHRAAIGGRD